jgi:hypothetical protein
LSFFSFPQTDLQIIDSAIQQGKGAEASVLGQAFTVQRLTSSTNVGVSSAPALYKNFPIVFERTTTKVKIENESFSLLSFELTCNNTYLKTGDLLTNTGFGADPNGVYTLASKRPRRPTIAMRTEWNCFISRPMPPAGAATQQPGSGAVFTPGYAGVTKASEHILTLVDGMYEFTATPGSQTASVYCGLQPTSRVRDVKEPPIPTAHPVPRFMAYVPTLPGEQLNERDIINLPNSDRYGIESLYSTDTTGLAGYVLICEKLAD